MRAYINNKPFDFDQEITILEAARQMGFFIPTGTSIPLATRR